ncbi:MAG TPA: hypothetical protein VN177_14155, partial [Myxococcales bacterium]|nr:hypothetical protein [Myxococcales bacterium]
IGRAVNVVKKSHGLFLEADVVPAVDFSRLDEVLVVLDHAAGPAVPQRDVPMPQGVASGPGAPGSGP